jgi:hypothetical protein
MIATVDEAFAFASKLRLAFAVHRSPFGVGGRLAFWRGPGYLDFKAAKRERLLVSVRVRSGRYTCREQQLEIPPANGERRTVNGEGERRTPQTTTALTVSSERCLFVNLILCRSDLRRPLSPQVL